MAGEQKEADGMNETVSLSTNILLGIIIGLLWVIRTALRQLTVQVAIVITAIRLGRPSLDVAMKSQGIDCMGMKSK